MIGGDINLQGDIIMLEAPDKIGYATWDDKDFVLPEEFSLNENSKLQDALKVFYGAGGTDFFQIVNPEKYASNWLEFMGNLYSDIVDGKYKSEGKPYSLPLSERERISLIEQGVPEIFVKEAPECFFQN